MLGGRVASRWAGFGVAVGVCASAELLRSSNVAPKVTILVKPLRLKVSIRTKTPLKFNSQVAGSAIAWLKNTLRPIRVVYVI